MRVQFDTRSRAGLALKHGDRYGQDRLAFRKRSSNSNSGCESRWVLLFDTLSGPAGTLGRGVRLVRDRLMGRALHSIAFELSRQYAATELRVAPDVSIASLSHATLRR